MSNTLRATKIDDEDEVYTTSPAPDEDSMDTVWRRRWSSDDDDDENQQQQWPRRVKGVMLEGYVEAPDGSDDGSEGIYGVARTKSLTDEDLEELKGCVDLGFGFSYEEIPELCSTLPALELCYSMSQRFLDEQQRSSGTSSPSGEVAVEQCAATANPIANWKISSPGDDPEDVKARLRYWAQAVACTVKLCS